MKKISLLGFLLLLLNFSVVSVYAEEEEEVLTAQELVDDCNKGYSPGNPTQSCMQYVAGLVVALEALQKMDPANKLFCLDPTLITPAEVTENVLTWMKNVPERLNEAAYILASQALHESYPCSS